MLYGEKPYDLSTLSHREATRRRVPIYCLPVVSGGPIACYEHKVTSGKLLRGAGIVSLCVRVCVCGLRHPRPLRMSYLSRWPYVFAERHTLAACGSSSSVVLAVSRSTRLDRGTNIRTS